ncbi:hypothetical protein V2J09_021000 [Rumex salicifolius]
MSCHLVSTRVPVFAGEQGMTSKMKGIYRGFKFISRFFVAKEREMEIGYPTDVKHLAHIGLDGSDGAAPSWMNDFKTSSSFSMSSVGSIGGSYRDPATAGFERSFGRQQTSDMNHPSTPKKQKHKKGRSSSTKKPSSFQ